MAGTAPTLHSVAAVAGVSTATASKALNGLPVSPESFAKVFAAAEELGYVPNLAARSMRSVRTMTIGMVINFHLHPHSELLGVLRTMVRDLEGKGYSVLVSVVSGAGADVDTLLRRFIERRVDGLFFWNARPEESLAWYRRAGVPVLAVGFRAEGCKDIPLVTVDGADAFDAAVDRLRELGHRVAAEISVATDTVLHGMFAYGEKLEWVDYAAGNDQDDVRAVLERMADDPRRPTVVFASNPTAVQILSTAPEMGIDVPGDLSVVSFTDSEDADLLRTPLSSMRTDYELMGHAAAAAMLDAIDGKTVDDVTVPDAVAWMERASIGPAPNRERHMLS